MKKLYLLFFILIIGSETHSQGYYPMLDSVSNDWYIIGNVIPVRTQQSAFCTYGQFTGLTLHRYTAGDALINGYNWEVIMEEIYGIGSSLCTFGYIREDNAARKVYFMDHQFSPEVLMYDFSMQPGDSILRTFVQPGGYYQDGWFTLDSIGTVTINAGLRRIFYLNNHQAFGNFPLQWIESVGHPGDFAYTYSCNMYGGFLNGCWNDPISRDFCELLSCFEHSQQKVYFDSCAHANALANGCFIYVDSCHYWNICTSLEENNIISSFEINPNPSPEEVTLQLESTSNTSAIVELYAMDGKKIMILDISLTQGKNEIKLRTENLVAASYIVRLKTNAGAVYRKLILMN